MAAQFELARWAGAAQRRGQRLSVLGAGVVGLAVERLGLAVLEAHLPAPNPTSLDVLEGGRMRGAGGQSCRDDRERELGGNDVRIAWIDGHL